MNMYQKREMRKNKKVEIKEDNSKQTNINWVISPFVNYIANPLIPRD